MTWVVGQQVQTLLGRPVQVQRNKVPKEWAMLDLYGNMIPNVDPKQECFEMLP